ncbi:uncharacterized protein [Lepisosteus oculatus]|uniref:Serine/threonine-protein kinase WNK2-like n=1 Tax=Lepisosteus oculatus TaxID=7918 RepID=W5N7Q7_LEPOC|nr:PREDICTED: serine/threonine-protein kinase WNK2-like [Lepisosteus oculatus]
MHAALVFLSLVSTCLTIPVYRQHFGLSTSNSNEFFRLSGLGYSGVGYGQPQALPFIPPYMFQQQQPPDVVALPPQLSLNPQVTGAGQGPLTPQGPLPPQLLLPPQVLVPSQGHLPPQMLFPPTQQEQLPASPQQPLNPQDPAAPQQPQTPNQVLPQYYPSITFPQQPGGQGLPYYIAYRYPHQQPPTILQPTQSPVQQQLEQPTQVPQLLFQKASQQPQGQVELEKFGQVTPETGAEIWPTTSAPEQITEATTTGTEETRPSFSFLFEP